MSILRHLRILPLLVLVAGLSFTVRLGDFVHGLHQSGTAMAQEEVNAEAPPMPGNQETQEETTDTVEMAASSADTESEGLPPIPIAAEGEEIDWQDAGDSEFVYSEVREELYRDLSERRMQLEEREKTLAHREAILEAAERELGQKFRELTAVRNEIQALLRKQSDEEKARLDSLVRIYEGMKAKDAARIFNTLDMDVLISVMAKMSERKSAPILAEMNPERARAVTILLAQQKQLPSLPPQ